MTPVSLAGGSAREPDVRREWVGVFDGVNLMLVGEGRGFVSMASRGRLVSPDAKLNPHETMTGFSVPPCSRARARLATLRNSKLLLVFTLLLPLSATFLHAYTWSSVKIGGGGTMTGIIVHPHYGSLLYARTDVGGAYRWDTGSQTWIPLTEEFPTKDYFKVDAMNIDPSDTTLQKVYIGVGDGAIGRVLRSASQGNSGTWVNTGLPTSVELDGNANYRWAGQRLAIDPNKPGRAFLGSRKDGLWLNTNINTSTVSASTWSQVPTSEVPIGSSSIGVTFVAFDTTGGVNGSGFTKNIYVGVWGSGVYKSTDAGVNFALVTGSPANSLQGQVNKNSGQVIVTHLTGVSRLTGTTWANITPSGAAGLHFSGLSIHKDDPNKVVVATRVGTNGSPGNGTSMVFYSSNGGTSWSVNKTGNATSTVPWWSASYHASAITTVHFAPTSHPNKVWFGDWYGAWETDDISISSPPWSNFVNGHEELVMHTIKSKPPTGSSAALLWSGAADLGGFRHMSLTAFPSATDRTPTINETGSIDIYEGNNNIIYVTGTNSGDTAGNGWRSGDGGNSWTAFDPASDPVLPDSARGGRIAVSALNSNLVVWVPTGNNPYFSTDGGVNWTASSGVTTTGLIGLGLWDIGSQLASNKGSENRFYIWKHDVGLYRSNTGSTAGSSFSIVTGNGLPTWSSGTEFGVKTVPGQNGGIWAYHDGSSGGLWKSTNSGSTFTQVSGVTRVRVMAFGAKASGSSHPAAVYIWGQRTGDTQNWLYRSDDMGTTWVKINDTNHQFGVSIRALDADRVTYGKVYVGTSGRGIVVGVP